ncbi:hypothetical protein [Pelosinus propionicus]|uniref:Uncharacterized protein n=1 Tax=Pelosinus propionicus DSM 13327 TaxID=1123291 RepID=A0A1I4MI99_9FIRM|nr:hypothetical protein [Pelosinus propionicus]SFM02790.1 hypothetical protein SAMN04490355_103416 [Pelosinus propionicus DSM 13327]
MPMSIYIKPIEALQLECINDIRGEFCQIRSQISSLEIHTLADSLFCQSSLAWPAILLELQKGRILDRLLNKLNEKVKAHGFSYERNLALRGPFPALSLKSLLPVVQEHRSTLRATRCVEFLGNKACSYSLKSVTKGIFPFQVDVATLAMETLGCSSKQQMKQAMLDLSERIKGRILNFLYDWEKLIIKQISEQLITIKQNSYLLLTEAAV